jgi:DNA-binding response OmpR family regulator
MREDSTQKTVLLVVDDELIKSLLTYQLKRQKYQEVEASSGEEALHERDRSGQSTWW